MDTEHVNTAGTCVFALSDKASDVARLVECLPSTREAEAGRSEVLGHSYYIESWRPAVLYETLLQNKNR